MRISQERVYENEEGSSLRFTEPKPAHVSCVRNPQAKQRLIKENGRNESGVLISRIGSFLVSAVYL